MRAPVTFSLLTILGALSGCNSCKRTSSSTTPTAVADKPSVDSGAETSDADTPETAPEELPKATVLPDIGCTTSPSLLWIDDPSAQFSCSDLRTPVPKGTKPATYVNASGAKVSPLEFTVSPSTELSIGLAVKNSKGMGYATSFVRYQLEGAPAAAKVDTATGKLRWRVNAPAGSTFLFEAATHVTMPEGERCVKQPIVVHVVDDDGTRAHQIANKERMNGFLRDLDCQWAHQGPDPEENSNNDAADEKRLRDRWACGGSMVTVVMKDLDGDGAKDAIVTFDEHLPSPPPAAPARWETGPGVQIHLRKGDDFTFAGEWPGHLVEADDGTLLVLDTNDEEHSFCPPRPYRSTGFSCDITRIEVRRLVGARVEWVGLHEGRPLPGEPELGTCPTTQLKLQKDGKGRLTGFLDETTIIPWNQKTPPSP